MIKRLCEIQKQLKESFSYNSDTGVFTRLDRKNSGGSFDKEGYLILKIKGKQYKAHRMAWLYHFGSLPENNIDHINRNKADNRIINLRDVTQLINNKNVDRKPNKGTGHVGIYEDDCTKGLLKKFTFKFDKKTHRFYSLKEAIKNRNKLYGTINQNA